jgi:hypothetical protein
MKGLVHGEPRFIEFEMKISLGIDRKIFVGSSFDIFADSFPNPDYEVDEWRSEILRKCRNNPGNSYLFQSKNPEVMYGWAIAFPSHDVMIGTTIESNRDWPLISKAPKIEERSYWMQVLSQNFDTMVSIEPILEFDLGDLVKIIKTINPQFVSIGADSKSHHLPEPPARKVEDLIYTLREITEVKIKDNLRRIVGDQRFPVEDREKSK